MIVFDDAEQAEIVEIATLRRRAAENAAREAYLASLQRRPCGFHLGPPGKPCIRPTCGASWEEHYGAPPHEAAKPHRAANRGPR
jgi:hypothetical protein